MTEHVHRKSIIAAVLAVAILASAIVLPRSTNAAISTGSWESLGCAFAGRSWVNASFIEADTFRTGGSCATYAAVRYNYLIGGSYYEPYWQVCYDSYYTCMATHAFTVNHLWTAHQIYVSGYWRQLEYLDTY